MDLALSILLAGCLFGAIVWAALLAGVRRLRSRRLSRWSHEQGLRFSREDPFDVAVRYAGFALFDGGHSARAENVTYGRLDSMPLRIFDLRFEVGHGTRRVVRRYDVAVVETPDPLPGLLLWDERDLEAAPLAAQVCDGQVGGWRYGGPAAAARAAAGALDAPDAPVHVQTLDGKIAAARPLAPRGGHAGQTERLRRLVAALGAPDEPNRTDVENAAGQ